MKRRWTKKQRRKLQNKYQFAQKLRENPTRWEAMLWERLKECQLGVWFQTQVVMQGWIMDFVCAEKRLIVELDGKEHDAKADAYRDRVMAKPPQNFHARWNAGYRTLRFPNREVEDDLEGVLKKIREALG